MSTTADYKTHGTHKLQMKLSSSSMVIIFGIRTCVRACVCVYESYFACRKIIF